MFDAFIFGHSGDQDDELVAPETAAQIICPAGFPQAAGEELENPVSVGVPEVVIHVFKVVEIGKGEVLCDGFDLAIISTGLMTSEALKAAVTLKRQDAISVRVINMPTIKPLDEEIVLRAARECHKIITVEEHSVIGGLGEAVCSLLSEKAPTPVRRIGVQDKFGHSGPAWEVLRDYGLTADAIADAVRSFVKEDQ